MAREVAAVLEKVVVELAVAAELVVAAGLATVEAAVGVAPPLEDSAAPQIVRAGPAAAWAAVRADQEARAVQVAQAAPAALVVLEVPEALEAAAAPAAPDNSASRANGARATAFAPFVYRSINDASWPQRIRLP
ncbi:MAG TPA: hypothetical protein VHL12_02855 [Gemmatimonadaceae bacterium]|nr:hypothetical protein [Gemmatimonadaceae bacterium]